MSYQFIFLGEHSSVGKHLSSKTVCFSLNEGDKSKLRHLDWPSECKGQLLSKLIEEARFIIWADEVDKILSENSFETDANDFHDFEKIASIDIPPDEEDLTQLLSQMKNSALKIINRQTVFVFPAQWPAEFLKQGNAYLQEMAKEVCTFFKEVSVDRPLPWTFLINGTSHQSDPLSTLIRLIHGLMLQENDSVDRLNRWKQKKGTILLSGPTGSGKSYAARLLAAENSSQFVEVNLAAISEVLLESRMRGYVEGAFTDAKKGGSKGWFEEADNGILFLDEFQSTPPSFQTQLLDVLSAVSDDIYIARVGADGVRKQFKVKIVIAINEEIESLLSQKRLRKDILYRVRHIESFPSLNNRLQRDKDHRYLRGLLATYRWKSFNGCDLFMSKPLSVDVLSRCFPTFTRSSLLELSNQNWEGNFRELERVAFDIFYECDFLNGSNQIEPLSVRSIIDSWTKNITNSKSTELSNSDLSSSDLRKLKEIQSAILNCKFIFSKILNGEHQSYYRSRPPLKKYLLENIHRLEPDILVDSRMKKFLGIERSE